MLNNCVIVVLTWLQCWERLLCGDVANLPDCLGEHDGAIGRPSLWVKILIWKCRVLLPSFQPEILIMFTALPVDIPLLPWPYAHQAKWLEWRYRSSKCRSPNLNFRLKAWMFFISRGMLFWWGNTNPIFSYPSHSLTELPPDVPQDGMSPL